MNDPFFVTPVDAGDDRGVAATNFEDDEAKRRAAGVQPFPHAEQFAQAVMQDRTDMVVTLHMALVRASAFWPHYKDKQFKNLMYPQSIFATVVKHKLRLITREDMKKDFTRNDDPFSLNIVGNMDLLDVSFAEGSVHGTPLLGFTFVANDQSGEQKTFTLLDRKTREHVLSFECAVILIISIYHGNHRGVDPFSRLPQLTQYNIIKDICDCISKLGFAVGSLNSVKFLLEKALENNEMYFMEIADYFGKLLKRNDNEQSFDGMAPSHGGMMDQSMESSNGTEQSFDSTGATTSADSNPYSTSYGRSNCQLALAALSRVAGKHGLPAAGTDDAMSISESSVVTSFSLLQQQIGDTLTVNTDDSWNFLEQDVASPTLEWPGKPQTDDEMHEWYNNELDHHVKALREAHWALNDAKDDIQVLWRAIQCQNTVLSRIDEKIQALETVKTWRARDRCIRELKDLRVSLIQENRLIVELGTVFASQHQA